mgnify:CR=1 FL=1
MSRDDPQNVRFMNLDWLESHDVSVDRSNYDLIYTAPLSESGTVPEQLGKNSISNSIWQKPVDFHSSSMSVSDIVAIKQDGKVSCHYCDSVGFTQIPGFLPENPLKNAEMAVEDDYGMIDGIINNGAKEPTVAELEQQARSGQPISLMDLADAVHREERGKAKKSVVDQLKKPAQSRTQKRQHPKRVRKGRFDMGNFTFEEMNLMCIYNTGSRTGLIDSLREMRGELSPEETELRELTDSALTKLCAMTDEDFAQLELYPDFDQ